MSIGEKIRSIRKSWKLNQDDFGAKFDMDRNQISNVERDIGKGNQKKIIAILVDKHGFSEQQFYGNEELKLKVDTSDVKEKYIRLLEEKLEERGESKEMKAMMLEQMRMAEELRAKLERMEAHLLRLMEEKENNQSSKNQ